MSKGPLRSKKELLIERLQAIFFLNYWEGDYIGYDVVLYHRGYDFIYKKKERKSCIRI